MKVFIDCDEWWPVYGLTVWKEGDLEPWGTEIEIDEALYFRYVQIADAFNEMQSELRKLPPYNDYD
jgi:hypothetical protein